MARPWSLPWHLLTADLALGERTLPGPLVAGWLIVVGTVIAYITGIAAVRRLSAAIGATIASLEVVASVVIAWWSLGQSLGPPQLLGGALVLSGALFAQLAVVRTRSVEPGKAKPGGSEPDGSTPVGAGLGEVSRDERETRGVRVRIAPRSSTPASGRSGSSPCHGGGPIPIRTV